MLTTGQLKAVMGHLARQVKQTWSVGHFSEPALALWAHKHMLLGQVTPGDKELVLGWQADRERSNRDRANNTLQDRTGSSDSATLETQNIIYYENEVRLYETGY